METPICRNCKYFRVHYIKFGRGYQKIDDGHCVFPRLKLRRGGTSACEHYLTE